MNRLFVLASLVATGCLPPSTVGEPLDEDVHYIGVPTDLGHAVACVAPSTRSQRPYCSFALTLCRNGRAVLRVGDVVMGGIYAMDESIARGTIEANVLALDLATMSEPEGPIVAGIRWELDAEHGSRTHVDAPIGCD